MVDVPDREKYKFKRDLEEIERCTGRGTELISLYIPVGRRISDVNAYLRNEYSQSSNIKSKSTRKNVMAAIESILSKLQYFKKPPENGLVIFVGHTLVSGDKTTMVSFVLEPIEPITTFLYRCDSQFYVEPLREMLVKKDAYGLIVIDRSEATIGLLKGKRAETIKNIQSLVPSKHSKGGQSAKRFERLIEIAAHEYFKKVGGLVNESFLEQQEMKGILVGGPGSTKNVFIEGDYIHHELKKKVINAFDTGYTNEYGLRELVQKAISTLTDLELSREKTLTQRFLNEVRKDDGGLAVYGEERVRRALENGAIDTILISEATRKYRAKVFCQDCGYKDSVTITTLSTPKPCPKCHSPLTVTEKTDVIEEFYNTAEQFGTKIELISRDSEEGELLLKAFDGIGAILRFKVGGTR